MVRPHQPCSGCEHCCHFFETFRGPDSLLCPHTQRSNETGQLSSHVSVRMDPLLVAFDICVGPSCQLLARCLPDQSSLGRALVGPVLLLPTDGQMSSRVRCLYSRANSKSRNSEKTSGHNFTVDLRRILARRYHYSLVLDPSLAFIRRSGRLVLLCSATLLVSR